MKTLEEIIEKYPFKSEPHPYDGEIEITYNWERIANDWASENVREYANELLSDNGHITRKKVVDVGNSFLDKF